MVENCEFFILNYHVYSRLVNEKRNDTVLNNFYSHDKKFNIICKEHKCVMNIRAPGNFVFFEIRCAVCVFSGGLNWYEPTLFYMCRNEKWLNEPRNRNSSRFRSFPKLTNFVNQNSRITDSAPHEVSLLDCNFTSNFLPIESPPETHHTLRTPVTRNSLEPW